MKKLLAALLVCLTPLAANAQSSKSTIVSAINVDFADNTAGAITAALLRSVTTTMVSSYVDWQTCGVQGGVIYYAAGISPTCLSPGTPGQYLQTFSTPIWNSLANSLSAGTGIGITGTITPTIAVSDTELNGIQNLSGSTGIVARTGSTSPVYVARTITGTINQITFTNGNGVSGNPTASLATLSTMLDTQFGSAQGGVIYRGASGWAFLSPGTSGQVFTTGGASTNPSYTTVAGTGTVQTITCGTGLTCSSNPITVSGTITPTIAVSADFFAGTANKLLDANVVFSTETTTTYGTTTAFDFSTFLNTKVTLTGNISTVNCTNMKAGQAGTISFIQDSTGSRTAAFNTGTCSSVFKFAGATFPTLTTSASAIDVLSYFCRTTSYCAAALSKGYNP